MVALLEISSKRTESRGPDVGRLLASVAVAALLAGLFPSPSFGQTDKPQERRRTLRVLAASSLTGVVRNLERRFERRRNTAVEVSFGGSSRLATQLRSGARADLYLSANRKWVERLARDGDVAPSTRRVFASNRLVVVVPTAAENRPETLDALRRSPPDRLALGGPNVPAGMYARSALRNAGAWKALRDRIVSAENVKRALQWVALGEARAGIVYATDARASEDVEIAFTLPERLHPAIRYEGAVPSSALHPKRGLRFLESLTGPVGREVLRGAGFSAPSDDAPDVDLRGAERSTGGVDPWSSVGLSLLVGLACLVGGLLPAVLLGWLLARRSFHGKSLVATLLLAPLALPPVVTGFILLRLFGRSGALGELLAIAGIRIPFTTLGAGLAAFVVSFPLYLLTARSAFEIVDRRYEEVSMTLGFRPRTTFWRVTIPLALPGLAAGGLLAFARAIGEFGATAVLAGNVPGETQTIPLAIYTLLESPSGYDSIWLLVGISLALSLVAVLGFEWFHRRQRRRGDPL